VASRRPLPSRRSRHSGSRTVTGPNRDAIRCGRQLCRDDLLLDPGRKLPARRVRQTQIRESAEITGAVGLQHVDAAGRIVDVLKAASAMMAPADGTMVQCPRALTVGKLVSLQP